MKGFSRLLADPKPAVNASFHKLEIRLLTILVFPHYNRESH